MFPLNIIVLWHRCHRITRHVWCCLTLKRGAKAWMAASDGVEAGQRSARQPDRRQSSVGWVAIILRTFIAFPPRAKIFAENLSPDAIFPCGHRGPTLNPPQSKRGGRSSGVEHNLAKVRVEGSNPFARSNQKGQPSGWPFALAGVHPNALERLRF